MRCPRGPKSFVPMRYEILAGRNVTPCFHLPAPIVSIIQMGREGSSMAIPVLANVIAPKTPNTRFTSNTNSGMREGSWCYLDLRLLSDSCTRGMFVCLGWALLLCSLTFSLSSFACKLCSLAVTLKHVLFLDYHLPQYFNKNNCNQINIPFKIKWSNTKNVVSIRILFKYFYLPYVLNKNKSISKSDGLNKTS